MLKKTVKDLAVTKQQINSYYEELERMFKAMRENHGDREADVICILTRLKKEGEKK